MFYTVDITIRCDEPPAAELGDRLLDRLAEAGAIGPAVSQDAESSTVGATFSVLAADVVSAFDQGRVYFGRAAGGAGVGGRTLIAVQVAEESDHR